MSYTADKDQIGNQTKGEELEIKYFVSDLNGFREKIEKLNARMVQDRVLEINLRFDTERNLLARQFRVLRLRYDTKARMTYKGPASNQDGIRLRKEIEFEVSDFSAARSFLLSASLHRALSGTKN